MATRLPTVLPQGTYLPTVNVNELWLEWLEHIIWAAAQWSMLLLALRGLTSILSAAGQNRFGEVLNFVTNPMLAPINHFMTGQSDVFEVNAAVAIAVYGIAGWLLAGMLYLIRQTSVRHQQESEM